MRTVWSASFLSALDLSLQPNLFGSWLTVYLDRTSRCSGHTFTLPKLHSAASIGHAEEKWTKWPLVTTSQRHTVSTITSALCKKWANNRLRGTNWLDTSCLISLVLLLKSKETEKARRSESWPGIGSEYSAPPKIRWGAPIPLVLLEKGSFQVRHTD